MKPLQSEAKRAALQLRSAQSAPAPLMKETTVLPVKDENKVTFHSVSLPVPLRSTTGLLVMLSLCEKPESSAAGRASTGFFVNESAAAEICALALHGALAIS